MCNCIEKIEKSYLEGNFEGKKITKASFGTWNGQEITILHMESDRKGNK